jgi:hypothetical protein
VFVSATVGNTRQAKDSAPKDIRKAPLNDGVFHLEMDKWAQPSIEKMGRDSNPGPLFDVQG